MANRFYFIVHYKNECKISPPLIREEEASQSCFGKHSWQCERVIPIPVNYGHNRAVQEYEKYCEQIGLSI